jgi:signal transduction histidine kinase/HAMP domain-containing protein
VSLRAKLLLAQAPLAVALAVMGWVAASSVSSLGRHSELILRENYRSVLAAQRMRESLERLEHGALLSLMTGSAREREESHRQRFESELQVAEGNVTEQGEREALRELRKRWELYQEHLGRLSAGTLDAAIIALLMRQLEPAFAATLEQAKLILDLNQDAMVRKSEEARREAARVGRLTVPAALTALLLGALISSLVTRRLLQPFELLARTVARLSEGDLEARVNIRGRDEVATLAHDVNTMATRLSQYRRSSLGELLLAQEASQAAIDSLPDPIVVFDSSGGILNVNQGAERLLGLVLETGADDSLEKVEPAVRRCLELARAHVLGGKGPYVPRGFDEAVRVATATGDLYLLPRATPVYSEEGAVSGATVVLQDVTRLRRVDDLRNNLVSTVAHELRTPLTSLRMAIHLCLEQTAGPITERQADLLYAAREECERLQAMVDEMLDLARIQNGRVGLNRAPVAPTTLIEAAVDAYRGPSEEAHLLLTSEVLPSLPSVLADRERLQLVLSNLLSNAIRHTPAGGRITVRAREEDETVRFEVSDTGPGIPAEYQSMIFDKFVRVPGTPGGSGLGLSIAKDVVEAHGGRIGVGSAPGEGSTFWFTVPVADSASRERS